jgi:hypothetical protein
VDAPDQGPLRPGQPAEPRQNCLARCRAKGKPPLARQATARASGVLKVTRVDLKTLNGLCNFFGIQPGGLFEYTPDAGV